ncbi:MAG: hydrogenase formation protein HypD [Candidatus Ranarchaeia archaeon]
MSNSFDIPTKFRDKKTAGKIIEKIKSFNHKFRFMHVCGTHQDSIMRFGLLKPLEEVGVQILQGPGCPVCVTTPKEIAEGITLAKSGVIITSFGDMLNIPSEFGSLLDNKSQGSDVRIVYGIWDALKIAEKNPDKEVVFLAVGFETTAPATAQVIRNKPVKNFSILSSHRYIPPVLKTVLELGEVNLDGLIQPGHVSAIIGEKPYEFIKNEYKIPQVISGFEPLDLLISMYSLCEQIVSNKPKIVNTYTRVVKPQGNIKAQEVLSEVFTPSSIEWRGFPKIENSGMELKKEYKEWDAREKFSDTLTQLENYSFKLPKGCKCDEVLRGLIEPSECPLFKKICTPTNPIGPCMVSEEGSCNIMYKYTK